MYGTAISYSMRLFSQYYLKNAFTVHNFSKKKSTEYVRNIFNSENNCFHYLFHKRYSFSLKYLCHNYFRRHSRMRQIALFKK